MSFIPVNSFVNHLGNVVFAKEEQACMYEKTLPIQIKQRFRHGKTIFEIYVCTFECKKAFIRPDEEFFVDPTEPDYTTIECTRENHVYVLGKFKVSERKDKTLEIKHVGPDSHDMDYFSAVFTELINQK